MGYGCVSCIIDNSALRGRRRMPNETRFRGRRRDALYPWLARSVQALGLGGKRLITIDDVWHARPELDHAVTRLGIAELVRRGWLRPVGVCGTCEFILG